MQASSDTETRNRYLHSLLDEPETDALLRLTTLVEHLFHVPVAYMALLDGAGKVAGRIGSGHEDGKLFGGFAVDQVLQAPVTVRDTADCDFPDFDWGELRFAASVPLRSRDGMTLGLLVIADRQTRADFSAEDETSLAELAEVLAGKMELRRIASQAIETELTLREAEGRFQAIANSAPLPMMCGGPDGALTFLNRAWLELTGRTLEEELGFGWLQGVHPDFRDQTMDRCWSAVSEREPVSIEIPLLCRDGSYRRMMGRGVSRFLEGGVFAGFIGCLTDAGEYVPGKAEAAERDQAAYR